jgi:uncharacterized RDD family membrane protein YckC
MEIWIGRDGERHGPYREEDVRQWLRSGQVSRDDLGWYEGLADWQPLSTLYPEELRSEPPAFDGAAVATPPPVASVLPQTTTASLEDYAGFWKRVGAYILDSIVLFIPLRLVGIPFGLSAAEDAMQKALLAVNNDPQAMLQIYERFYHDLRFYFLLTTLLTWLYFAACESSAWQATIGKLALGIRVTDLRGARISFPRAIGRYAGKYLSAAILGIGFLMVAFTRRKQGLHDMLANTLVLNGRASELNRDSRSSTQADRPGSFNA